MREATAVFSFALFASTLVHVNGKGVAFSCYSGKEGRIIPHCPLKISYTAEDGAQYECHLFPQIPITKCDLGEEYVNNGIFTAPSDGIYTFNLIAPFGLYFQMGQKILEWSKKGWRQTLRIEMVKVSAPGQTNEATKVVDRSDFFSSLAFAAKMEGDDQNLRKNSGKYYKLESTLSLNEGDQVYVRMDMNDFLFVGKGEEFTDIRTTYHHSRYKGGEYDLRKIYIYYHNSQPKWVRVNTITFESRVARSSPLHLPRL